MVNSLQLTSTDLGAAESAGRLARNLLGIVSAIVNLNQLDTECIFSICDS